MNEHLNFGPHLDCAFVFECFRAYAEFDGGVVVIRTLTSLIERYEALPG